MKSATRILAAVLLSTALGAVVVPAQANAATGALSGRVTTESGFPVVASVTATASNGSAQFGQTGPDGSYRFAALESGQYTIQFSLSNGARQYAHGKLSNATADRFEVRAGEETVVNETLLPQGNLAGRLVDFDGTPLAGAVVIIRVLDGNSSFFRLTRADGMWNVDGAFVGRYQVDFFYSDTIQQSAFSKVGKAQPDVITVAANATTRVDDTAIARTSLHVTATDAVTGAAVTNFSVSVGRRGRSTETGDLVVDGIQAGTYDAEVFADGYETARIEVTLTVDAQGQLSVVLPRSASIFAKVVDAATGLPVPGICVGTFNRARAFVGDDYCSATSNAAGDTVMDRLRPGTYQLLAAPGFSAPRGYGAQWVGENGGTGRQLLAKSFTIAQGQHITGLVIQLDRAGTITGHVSTPDGQLPRFGTVNVLSGHPFAGSSLGVPINDDGTYTIDFLGPYDWPLLFLAQNQGWQWSGQVGDRLFARTVKVTSGVTATYDFRFRAPVNVTVKGLSLDDQVLFYNAVTGDIMGVAHGFERDEMMANMVGPQLVKLEAWPSGVNPYWIGGDDFAHARLYWIPASGSKTITLG